MLSWSTLNTVARSTRTSTRLRVPASRNTWICKGWVAGFRKAKSLCRASCPQAPSLPYRLAGRRQGLWGLQWVGLLQAGTKVIEEYKGAFLHRQAQELALQEQDRAG